jgi:hypothetical protein
LPESFAKVKAMVKEGEDPVDAELAVFGATQFQVGAYLLGLWGFKNPIVEAVAYVDRPSALPAGGLDVATLVHVARVLAGPFPGFALGEISNSVGRMALDMEHLDRLGKDERLGAWMIEAQKVS